MIPGVCEKLQEFAGAANQASPGTETATCVRNIGKSRDLLDGSKQTDRLSRQARCLIKNRTENLTAPAPAVISHNFSQNTPPIYYTMYY